MCQSHSHQFNIYNLVNRAFGNRIKLCSREFFSSACWMGWGKERAKKTTWKTASVTRKSFFKGTTNVRLLLHFVPIRIQDTQYGLSSELHDKWFANVLKVSQFFSVVSFCRSHHTIIITALWMLTITYDNANANLSVYYAIFNQKTDEIWHSLSLFECFFFALLCFVVMSEFYCPWNAINYLSWAQSILIYKYSEIFSRLLVFGLW